MAAFPQIIGVVPVPAFGHRRLSRAVAALRFFASARPVPAFLLWLRFLGGVSATDRRAFVVVACFPPTARWRGAFFPPRPIRAAVWRHASTSVFSVRWCGDGFRRLAIGGSFFAARRCGELPRVSHRVPRVGRSVPRIAPPTAAAPSFSSSTYSRRFFLWRFFLSRPHFERRETFLRRCAFCWPFRVSCAPLHAVAVFSYRSRCR